LDRFTAAELGVARRQENAGATELRHGHFERHARTRRGFFKNHPERLAAHDVVAFATLLHRFQFNGAGNQPVQFCRRQVQQGEKVALAHAASCAATQASTASLRRSTRIVISSSLITSGGIRRTTDSAVTLISRPRSRHRPTSSPQGRSNCTPLIRPWPRTSLTMVISAKASRRAWRSNSPRAGTVSITPALRVSTTVTAVAQPSGLPP